jgi:F-type H+-transporting ATPase subunit epsilon
MRLQILTPERSLFDGEVDRVLLPGEGGGFEVLKDHAPILSSLAPGEVRVAVGKKENPYHVTGGFFEFAHNKAVVLADSAETPEEINIARAEAARQRAEKRLENHREIHVIRAQKALARAISRLRFAGKYGANENSDS